ncbi:MAG: glycosyltransferase [Faecousia sp.]
MKVMHVLNSRIYTGAEKVVCQIIRAFQGTDIEMVYCSPYSENVEGMLSEQDVPYLSMDSLTPGNLKAVIRQFQPDLIHAHDMRASFVSALCCGKIPLVSHIHNNAYDARGLSLKSIAYLIAGFKAKHIFWVSNSSYEGYVFHKLFKKKSSVLYNIIDTKQIFEKLAQDGNVYDFDVIYVGRLTYQKDPQRLMRVCAQLKERKPDLKVAIVGAGELEEETLQLRDRLGLQENVQYLGFQSNPMKMVHDSKAMVLTSRWEGTPLCAMEAMVLGTPVVSTPSDGMRDLITNGVSGYLCQEDTDLVEALWRIITDPDHRQRLSENAVKRFAEINDAPGYYKTIEASYR